MTGASISFSSPDESASLGPLPSLREELRLLPAAPERDGSPTWVIQDPVNNRFYRIGWLEFELLSRWHLGRGADILTAVAGETLLEPSADELETLLHFLATNQLLWLPDAQSTNRRLAIAEHSKLSRWQWWLHHYLFFRIPLWRPDRFLDRIYPWVQRIYSPGFAWLVVLLSVLGLVLASRDWEGLTHGFHQALSPAGLLGYFCALAFAKSLHELAHAFTAKRHGVRVAHMGVAFVVMWPMLYTDTSETWRLPDRRQRLGIAIAGITAELALAGLSTLLWALLPPGPMREALFLLATTSWIISLALNASPFMRFDGYFVLSDLLDIPNLHERAGAIARARMRRLLLGWDEPDPEDLGANLNRFLTVFAWITWIYRLTVFLGIAAAVYFFFFKLLGIFLFLVEIVWFVIRPFHEELRVWAKRWNETRSPYRVALTLAVLAGGGLLFIPWRTQIEAPAWIHAERGYQIFSPLPARVQSLPKEGVSVAADTPLFVLESPEALERAQLARIDVEALQAQITGLQGLPQGEEMRASLNSQLAMNRAELEGQNAEQVRLVLRAAHAGVIVDRDERTHVGDWVSPRQPLASLIDPSSWVVEAYVSQRDLARAEPGAKARFYPASDRMTPVSGTVIGVDKQRTPSLPDPILATPYGGAITIVEDRTGGANPLAPSDPLYRVRIRLDSNPAQARIQRGMAVIDSPRRSLGWDWINAALAVIAREADF